MKKGKFFLLCTLMLMSSYCLWASEYSIRQYLDRQKGNLHPVEGIWQSTDGFKYGIIYSGYGRYGMEILSVPSTYSDFFSVGEKKGTIITEGVQMEFILLRIIWYIGGFLGMEE